MGGGVAYTGVMAKRKGVIHKKTVFLKKSPKRLAAKRKMLAIKALKPAARRKALSGE